MNDIEKTLCLDDELRTAVNLILSGFEELQGISMANNFYHLPQLLLASGFERLIKCYFCLVHESRNNEYPEWKYLKDLGHNLEDMKETLTHEYFVTNEIPLLCSDLEFLKNDPHLNRIIHILSEFGLKARYYNLDIVTGSQKPPIDPESEWETLGHDLEDITPYLASEAQETLYRDYYPRVNAKIIARLERLCRAIALQFTLGKHGGKLQEFSSILTRFRNLRNNEFGTIDYRHTVERSKEKWQKRSKEEVTGSRWPSVIITEEGFDEDWPFRFNEVVVECRDKLFCIVNIEGYDFSLNGAAKSRFGFPFPHDAGVAILGRSVGTFVDKAFSLSSVDSKGNST